MCDVFVATVITRAVTGLHNSYPRGLASLEFGSKEYERLPFQWNFQKFRGEFKWNGSSRWNVFGKKVIPFEVFPFSRFDRNARKFLYHLSTITSARETRPFRLLFNRNNPFFWQMIQHIPIFFFLVQNVQFHLWKHSHRKFHSNDKPSMSFKDLPLFYETIGGS